VALWITERLGTARWGDPEVGDVRVVDVRDLLDRGGNARSVVADRIDAAVRAVRERGRVVICCDHGMSRSNAIAAGVLAKLDGIPFDEAAGRVVRLAGAAHVKTEMLATVRAALGEARERNRRGGRRSVLVTGGSGFVGKALIERAGSRWEICAPPRRQVDLLDGAAALSLALRASRADTLVHLANPRIPVDIAAMGASIAMLKSALAACCTEGVRLVYLSGWMVYDGYRTDRILASEGLPRNPGGIYGETKELSESLIRMSAAREGTATAIVRPAMLYGGAGEKPRFLYHFLQRALSSQPIVTHRYRNGLPVVDLLHVEDLARLLVEVVESDFTGVVNAGSGDAISTADLAKRIATLAGAEGPTFTIDVEDETCGIVMDNARATDKFGWSPEIDIDAGLGRIVERYSAARAPAFAAAA